MKLRELAYYTGRATATVLREVGKKYILIGKDTRQSGDMLEAALTAGITSVGVNVVRLGVIPTPGVAYLTKRYNAMAGIVISASHNPGEYNGIKIFSHTGYKLPDEVEDQIENLILHHRDKVACPIGANLGTSLPDEGKVDASFIFGNDRRQEIGEMARADVRNPVFHGLIGIISGRNKLHFQPPSYL